MASSGPSTKMGHVMPCARVRYPSLRASQPIGADDGPVDGARLGIPVGPAEGRAEGAIVGLEKLRKVTSSAARPAIADVGNSELLVDISGDVVLIVGCIASRSETSVEDGRLMGAALDRIMGVVLGVIESGANPPTLNNSVVVPLDISSVLSINKTVVKAAKAKIAPAKIKALVTADMQGFPAAAIAILLAPLAADPPIKIDAWTAIGCIAELTFESCPMLRSLLT
jgi:hypothetical protein